MERNSTIVETKDIKWCVAVRRAMCVFVHFLIDTNGRAYYLNDEHRRSLVIHFMGLLITF